MFLVVFFYDMTVYLPTTNQTTKPQVKKIFVKEKVIIS